MNATKIAFSSLAVLLAVAACSPPKPQPTDGKELTAGVVQKEIRRGMTQAEVAAALGSPNIVTKDRSGDETWVYDKIATSASYGSASNNSPLLLGLLIGQYGDSSGYSNSTQKTLTVIIKYDAHSLVDTYSYHQTKF